MLRHQGEHVSCHVVTARLLPSGEPRYVLQSLVDSEYALDGRPATEPLGNRCLTLHVGE